MIELNNIIKELKTSDFVLNCLMPLGYVTALPVLSVRNGKMCLTVPFLKYKVTGEPDKTLVYPIRYTVTLTLPDKKIVGFEDLAVNPLFAKVDFNKAIGLFRHESVKQYNKKEYKAKREELYAMYDKVIAAFLEESNYSDKDDEKMSELMKIILEPSLKPMYKILNEDFYNKYIK